MDTATLAYVGSAIISAFRPILFKHYKSFMLFTVIISLASMWIGAAMYLVYEGGLDRLKSGIKESLEWKHIKLSLLSETRFMSKVFSLLFLPVSVAVPLSELWIASAAYFDKRINGVPYTLDKMLTIGALIFGGLLIWWADYTDVKTETSLFKYVIGGLLMLVNIILSGYMLITFRNIDVNDGPGKTMMIESTGSLILLLPLLLFIKWPSWKMVIALILGTTLVFNIDILLKFIGLRGVSAYKAITLGAVTTVIGTVLGIFVYSESITFLKMAGLFILVATVVYSGIINKK